jgi:hypothetical protein
MPIVVPGGVNSMVGELAGDKEASLVKARKEARAKIVEQIQSICEAVAGHYGFVVRPTILPVRGWFDFVREIGAGIVANFTFYHALVSDYKGENGERRDTFSYSISSPNKVVSTDIFNHDYVIEGDRYQSFGEGLDQGRKDAIRDIISSILKDQPRVRANVQAA